MYASHTTYENTFVLLNLCFQMVFRNHLKYSIFNFTNFLSHPQQKLHTGKSIERDPSIDRLIEIRTVLEKIRPIDYKLRYQIDKLVKTAVTGVTNSKDPINYKVRHIKSNSFHFKHITICVMCMNLIAIFWFKFFLAKLKRTHNTNRNGWHSRE